MPKKTKLFLIIFATIISLIVLVIFLFSAHNSTPPKITSIKYSPLSPNSSEFVSLVFDQPLSQDLFQISSSPEEQWEIKSLSPTHFVLIPHLPLPPNTPYQLQLTYDHTIIPPINFRTPPSTVNYRDNFLLQQKMDQQYPLKKYTPHTTKNYQAYYVAPFKLKIIVKNKQLSNQQILQLVKNWVASKNIDPDSHTYLISP